MKIRDTITKILNASVSVSAKDYTCFLSIGAHSIAGFCLAMQFGREWWAIPCGFALWISHLTVESTLK